MSTGAMTTLSKGFGPGAVQAGSPMAATQDSTRAKQSQARDTYLSPKATLRKSLDAAWRKEKQTSDKTLAFVQKHVEAYFAAPSVERQPVYERTRRPGLLGRLGLTRQVKVDGAERIVAKVVLDMQAEGAPSAAELKQSWRRVRAFLRSTGWSDCTCRMTTKKSLNKDATSHYALARVELTLAQVRTTSRRAMRDQNT